MSPEAKERKQPRPREEEFSQLDPLRIGETLGWENNNISQRDYETSWHFAGPVSLSITRFEKGRHVFGSANVKRIIDGIIVASANIYDISSIEFNKNQKQIVFRRKDKGAFIVKGSGQLQGNADILIPEPTTH